MATDSMERMGGHNDNLPHSIGAGLSDDELGGTMAQGAASPGAAPATHRDHAANPDATDTDAADDAGWQRTRNPPA